jgi:glycine/D-amino acid oxidase-like deaminating enzyme
MAGLAAALAFARHGRRVVLVERDGSVEGIDADGLFEHWSRPGIAHFRQPHNFLGLAHRLLLEHAPDVLDTVFGLGALENRQYELLPGDAQPDDRSWSMRSGGRRQSWLGSRNSALRRPSSGGANAASSYYSRHFRFRPSIQRRSNGR